MSPKHLFTGKLVLLSPSLAKAFEKLDKDASIKSHKIAQSRGKISY
jgi:hypothetical protein